MNVSLERWYWTAGVAPIAAAIFYIILLAISFGRLPTEVPVHFGTDGSPNGYMHKALWLVLSPLLLGGLTMLVFTTRPSLGSFPFIGTTLMYWIAIGMTFGAFFEVVRSASTQGHYRFTALLIGGIVVPAIEVVLSLTLRMWWLQS